MWYPCDDAISPIDESQRSTLPQEKQMNTDATTLVQFGTIGNDFSARVCPSTLHPTVEEIHLRDEIDDILSIEYDCYTIC